MTTPWEGVRVETENRTDTDYCRVPTRSYHNLTGQRSQHVVDIHRAVVLYYHCPENALAHQRLQGYPDLLVVIILNYTRAVSAKPPSYNKELEVRGMVFVTKTENANSREFWRILKNLGLSFASTFVKDFAQVFILTCEMGVLLVKLLSTQAENNKLI